MTKIKPIFIIPGFRHSPKNKAYKEIAKILRREGYYPVLMNIQWRQTTISQNVENFVKKFKKNTSRKKYILGFSFGAMIAFIASTKVSASGVVLCSLSPYFKEDLLKLNKNLLSSISVKRYNDFSNLHCEYIAKQIKVKQIHMLYGAREARSLIKRVTETYDQITSVNKYLIRIKKADHDMGHKRYLDKIHQIAKELN